MHKLEQIQFNRWCVQQEDSMFAVIISPEKRMLPLHSIYYVEKAMVDLATMHTLDLGIKAEAYKRIKAAAKKFGLNLEYEPLTTPVPKFPEPEDQDWQNFMVESFL